MKKLLIITISVLFSVISYAQTIEDGSKWWDGKNLYRACVSDPNEAFFELVNEEHRYTGNSACLCLTQAIQFQTQFIG